jgi:predicted flap endonuclease-1-like 5' DNA nuclease
MVLVEPGRKTAMIQMIEANWLSLILALIIGVLVAWWLFGRASSVAKPRERRPDVLDEGAAPAQRNQALIDAPPAATTIIPPSPSGTLAGMGEVIAVAAQDEVEAATSAPAPAPAVTDTEADDLSQLKGVGPKLVALLHGMGITRYAQIAAWTDEDIARIDTQLGAFKGRVTRDNWVEQAKFLASGDRAGFEGKFGKL